MTNVKKKLIRSRAKLFTLNLWCAPLESGLAIYQSTIGELYEGSSRIRFCLKCGSIESIQDMKKETHSCSVLFKSFPVLVTTSWKLLSDFFSTNVHLEVLKQEGVTLEDRNLITSSKEIKFEEISFVNEEEASPISISD